MTALKRWEERPIEEASLFNPAFIGALIFEFVKPYEKAHVQGAPITFLPLALAVVLHKPTRKRLPGTTVTSMFEWLQNNEDVLIGLGQRSRGVAPYMQEAFRFLLSSSHLGLKDRHYIGIGPIKANFSPKFLESSTPEVREIVSKMQFLSRWFAKSGSETTILAGWGVRP
ncbi:three component ABC system middle component [Pseudovibrio sp. SCP19]|uniref:three component ABC system middle component n=1 Tax=Pseudovibrio sp. SCP19 TaxID=3141374 RepID=UPI00333C2304